MDETNLKDLLSQDLQAAETKLEALLKELAELNMEDDCNGSSDREMLSLRRRYRPAARMAGNDSPQGAMQAMPGHAEGAGAGGRDGAV